MEKHLLFEGSISGKAKFSPDIVIQETQVGTNKYELKFHFFLDEFITYDIEVGMSVNDLQRQKTGLRNEYDFVHELIREKIKKNEEIDLDETYSKFLEIGNDLREHLIVKNTGTPEEFWELLFGRPSDDPGYIAITTSEKFAIPYELLSLGSGTTDVLGSMLGSKYKFSRRLSSQNHESGYIGKQIPRIGTIFNLNLEGVIRSEKSFFKSKVISKELIHIDYTDPLICDVTELKKKISGQDHDILHLDCHIDIGYGTGDYYLDFGDLKIDIVEIKQLSEFINNKLVFINGCRSHSPQVSETIDFTNRLIKMSASSVISVDVDIPDIIASKVSVIFYDKLLNPSDSYRFDDILHEIALKLYSSEKDIGGFFYSVFGNVQHFNPLNN